MAKRRRRWLSYVPDFDVVQTHRRSSDTVVLVPVYNEMPGLRRVMDSIHACWKGDILTVDDGSTDLSPEVLRLFADIHIIRDRVNAGAGGALLAGFAYADALGYKHIITLDSDGQHLPLLIAEFFRQISRRCDPHDLDCLEYDFVWGSRYVHGYPPLSPPFQLRQEVNKIVLDRLNAITGYGLTDAFCGFRAYRLASLRRLRLTECGYGMLLQMTIQAWRARIRLTEIPVPLVYLDATRNFQHQFHHTRQRLTYYLSVIARESGDAYAVD